MTILLNKTFDRDALMGEHLNTERISALLDEPWADKNGQAHLETCADCQAEFERLSRMRMGLSGLPDLEVPRGQWAAIEAMLDASEVGGGTRSIGRRFARRLLVPGPLQAAAGLVLFAGGVFAGLQLTTGGGTPDSPADLPAVVSSGDDRALLDGLNQMESLRSPLTQVGEGAAGSSSSPAFPGRDPLAAAQELARLEGSIRALREHLDADPDDVMASAYLSELVEMRDRLAEELGRSSGSRTW